MVAVKKKFPILSDGRIDINAWLDYIALASPLQNVELIHKAILFTENATKGLTTFYGQSCLEQSLEMAEIVIDLKLDEEAVAAAILTTTLLHTKTTIDSIKGKTNENIAKLLAAVKQMDVLDTLIPNVKKARNEIQIDRLRKTYLAMISDVRVVLIKLALQLSIMRGIKKINADDRHRLGQETLDIYAPLANRLGIGQIKWELEDLAFHYTDPETYKMIAKFLSERRVDREERIREVINRLKEELSKHNIKANITGRAKHIYSIYLKMQKKHLDYKNIYDASAVRILVHTIPDCYTALSIVHHLWEHIPQEFDDYIAKPKPNGYCSIHTALIGPQNKNLEIQIRTYDMHDKAEHGLAAHWLYKENKKDHAGYETKIAFLRQLLSWHNELAEHAPAADKIFEDRVYVFTPVGDIIDLSKGATPLDFAYHIHSALGHRCRGAKINGHIVPLTYELKTGDHIEIISIKNGTPSRDWLNKELGYIKTPRAYSKINQWFRQQEIDQYITAAKEALEKEFTRASIMHPDLHKIAAQLNFKNVDSLLSAIGHGSIRVSQIVHAATQTMEKKTAFVPLVSTPLPTKETLTSFQIAGIGDLLTRIAKCCKPIPGDTIIGYISQGRGVTIHRQTCNNIKNLLVEHQNKLIHVSWDTKHGAYDVDLEIRGESREALLREITSILANEKVDLISLNSTMNKKTNLLFVRITIQIQNNAQLRKFIHEVGQLPHVTHVRRLAK